jgi:hypothetical protein
MLSSSPLNWLLLLPLLGSCAGFVDADDFLLPAPEVDPDGPPTRAVRSSRHADTGALAARWSVLVYPDGRVLRDGGEERFHPDGTPAVQRHFAAGRPDGAWQRWYEDGSLRSSYEYVARVPTPMRFFHTGGHPSAVGLAVEGQREGGWTFWYPDGVVRQEGPYLAGVREGVWTLRWPSGGLRSRGTYRDDERVGEWKHWPERPPTLDSVWSPPTPVSSDR